MPSSKLITIYTHAPKDRFLLWGWGFRKRTCFKTKTGNVGNKCALIQGRGVLFRMKKGISISRGEATARIRDLKECPGTPLQEIHFHNQRGQFGLFGNVEGHDFLPPPPARRSGASATFLE